MTDNDIFAALERMDKRLDAIDKKLAQLTGKSGKGGEIADDADLDGKYGDEEIRKMPSAKYWEGESFVGMRMSETSADFLDAYSRYKDACAYMNEKSGDESKAKYIGYDRKSAARARGWSKRIREGAIKTKTKDESGWNDNDNGGSEELPF